MKEALETSQRAETSRNTAEFREVPSVEPACAAELGSVALCAACPLVRLFGDCPKEIRAGSAQKADQPAAEAVDPFGLNDGFEISNEFLVPYGVLPVVTSSISEEAHPDVAVKAVKALESSPPHTVAHNEPIPSRVESLESSIQADRMTPFFSAAPFETEPVRSTSDRSRAKHSSEVIAKPEPSAEVEPTVAIFTPLLAYGPTDLDTRSERLEVDADIHTDTSIGRGVAAAANPLYEETAPASIQYMSTTESTIPSKSESEPVITERIVRPILATESYLDVLFDDSVSFVTAEMVAVETPRPSEQAESVNQPELPEESGLVEAEVVAVSEVSVLDSTEPVTASVVDRSLENAVLILDETNSQLRGQLGAHVPTRVYREDEQQVDDAYRDAQGSVMVLDEEYTPNSSEPTALWVTAALHPISLRLLGVMAVFAYKIAPAA